MKKNYLKNAYNMITYNFRTLLGFEFIYKLIIRLIFMPIAISGFNLAMKLTGFTYLTLENIAKFAINPITIVLLLLIIIFLTMVTLFDITTLIVIFDESYHKKKIGVRDSVKIALNKCKNIFKLKNISVAFLVLFLIPFLNVGIESNVISSIKLPEFIMDYIYSDRLYFVIYIVVYIFLLSILSKWIYSLHYMVIEDKSYKEARKSSKELIKGSSIKDIVKILLFEAIVSVLCLLFIIAGELIILFINDLLSKLLIIKSVFITLIWVFMSVSIFVLSFISNGVSYAVISSLYYKHKLDKKEKIIEIKYEEKKKYKKKHILLRIATIIIVILAITGGTLLTYQVVTGKANLNIEFTKNMEITAHRGASVKYPENTMSAFKGAKKLGASWIELDVQQTKDRQIVVSHDSNLSRVAGVNKDIIDMSYDEIKKLDVGSFFDKKFKGERMPLLSEVLEFAKENNIRLNIELKPTGKEVDFERQVVDLINKYNFKDRCVISSQTYSILENTKKYDKNIKTLYVMSIAIGNITDAKYADGFSVEATNVTTNQVKRVHNAGKELYAWTVNTEESINHMIDMNVDNIITDNIELGKELVKKSKHSDIINEILKLLSD